MLMLSGDVLYGDVLIRTIGNHQIEIENLKGIFHYDENKIVVQGKRQWVIICGRNLVVVTYTNCLMRLSGEIRVIEFRMEEGCE